MHKKLTPILFLVLIFLPYSALAEDNDELLLEDSFIDKVFSNYSAGLGGGIPFGGAGFSLEGEVVDKIALGVGLGYYPGKDPTEKKPEEYPDGPMWSVGAKYYPVGFDAMLRPKISAYYGAIHAQGDVLEGAAVGGGLGLMMLPYLYFDVEYLYVFNDDLPNVFSVGAGFVVILGHISGWGV